jgi:hypothetical protein
VAEQTPANFDMVDTPEELAAYAPEVRELLVDCQPLGEYFDAANNVALKHFKVHWWVVVLAAVSGMLAVLFAMVQLEGERILSLTSSEIEVMEIIAALLAGFCVLLGTWAAFDRRWRLNRFLAEQCRLIKFDYLLHAGHWLSRSKEDRAKYLKSLLDELSRQTPESPRSWVLREFNLLLGQKPKVGSLTPAVLASLKDYYVTKRLSWQKGYFNKEATRRHTWERYTKHIAPLCFFLSVGAACAHFVWEIAHHIEEKPVASQKKHSVDQGVVEEAPAQTNGSSAKAEDHDPDIVSLRLLLAAACLPVFGAAWRTFRGANEFGRNTNRYIAMNAELGELNTQLEQADKPEDTLESLWHIERALDSEHRSWTRLMIEAEWFG